MSNMPKFDGEAFDKWQSHEVEDGLYPEELEARNRAGCMELFAIVLWCAFGAACWWALVEAWQLLFG